MSKKVIGALLAIVMVLSVFSFTVFAAGATKYEVADNEYKQIWGLRTNGDKIDVIFCNNEELFHFSYQRYIENCLRNTFGFKGTPIKLIIREKGDDK